VGDHGGGADIAIPAAQSGIDNKTPEPLKKGKNITMVTLEELRGIIGCTPNDIVEFK